MFYLTFFYGLYFVMYVINFDLFLFQVVDQTKFRP